MSIAGKQRVGVYLLPSVAIRLREKAFRQKVSQGAVVTKALVLLWESEKREAKK